MPLMAQGADLQYLQCVSLIHPCPILLVRSSGHHTGDLSNQPANGRPSINPSTIQALEIPPGPATNTAAPVGLMGGYGHPEGPIICRPYLPRRRLSA